MNIFVRQEIENSGNCLTVDDPAIIKMNTGNIEIDRQIDKKIDKKIDR